MSTKKASEKGIIACQCLRKAVRDELKKKAMLGHSAVISRNGKTCVVSAEEALKIAGKE